MKSRSIEDQLREEYFSLLPRMRRVAAQLEAEVRYHLVPISNRLERFEQLAVKSRVKDCESAVEKLLHRQEGGAIDAEKPEL
jgi:hypothetical protein